MERQVDDLLTLLELGEAENDAATIEEVEQQVDPLRERLDELEFQLALAGDYDASDAFLSIHASEGGTE